MGRLRAIEISRSAVDADESRGLTADRRFGAIAAHDDRHRSRMRPCRLRRTSAGPRSAPSSSWRARYVSSASLLTSTSRKKRSTPGKTRPAFAFTRFRKRVEIQRRECLLRIKLVLRMADEQLSIDEKHVGFDAAKAMVECIRAAVARASSHCARAHVTAASPSPLLERTQAEAIATEAIKATSRSVWRHMQRCSRTRHVDRTSHRIRVLARANQAAVRRAAARQPCGHRNRLSAACRRREERARPVLASSVQARRQRRAQTSRRCHSRSLRFRR